MKLKTNMKKLFCINFIVIVTLISTCFTSIEESTNTFKLFVSSFPSPKINTGFKTNLKNLKRTARSTDLMKRKISKDTQSRTIIKRALTPSMKKQNKKQILNNHTSTSFTSSRGGVSSSITKTSIPMRVYPKLIVITVPIAVILSLAMNNGSTNEVSTLKQLSEFQQQTQMQDIDMVLLEINESVEKLESLGTNILDAALPQDATDLLSITLGESLAGVLGAVSTWGVNLGLQIGNPGMLLPRNGSAQDDNQVSVITTTNQKRGKFLGMDMNINNLWNSNNEIQSQKNGIKNYGNNVEGNNDMITTTTSKSNVDILFNEAVADSDYFLTRAAASPLIGAVGMSGQLASALTVLLASVPYQIIKSSARLKEQRIREDMYFDALLLEEKLKQKQSFFGRRIQMPSMMSMPTQRLSPSSPMSSTTNASRMISTSKGEPMEMGYKFDFVELFADVCKWLEYDVLMTDFGGTLKWVNSGVPINAGLESAAFGFLAALSSQIYADVLYSVSDSMGTKAKRDEVRSRSIDDYIQIYSVKCLSAATLFGVYETARLPITRVINNLLSGGYDSCLGSDDFDFCLETYFLANPAEATPDAQFRSFVVALVNLFDRFGDISNENVDAAGLIRSLYVQLYSIIGFDFSFAYEISII